jgi:hypothetical protein
MNARIAKSIWPWALLACVLSLVLWKGVPSEHQITALNIISLLGIISLAIPTIRVNEQGKLIESVRSTQVKITSIQNSLEDNNDISDQQREVLKKDLENRKATMQYHIDTLATEKGAWTRPVHNFLYLGYVLLLGASIVRVLSL